MTPLFLNGALAVIAGMLLNFTPCVLPVIPLKVRTVLREIEHNTTSRVLAAFFLLLGSLLFFVTLGGLTAYLGFKWGEIFQSKIFLVLLSLFLMISGILMFFNWSFRLPQFLYRVPIHRYLGAFLTGVLAGILSTPCSGPFLGAVLAYAVTQSPVVIIVLFIAIGFGLSLPYVGMLLFPQLIKYVPKNGRLGIQVESILAFILIAGALFFSQSIVPHLFLFILWWGFGIGIFIWSLLWIKKGPTLSERVLPVITFLLVITIVSSLIIPSHRESLNWRPYDETLLKQIMGKPIMLEFTADWCINCKVLEKTTYASQEVIQAAKEVGLISLRVDMTEFNENLLKLFDYYGGTVLPHAVLLNRQGEPVTKFTGMMSVQSLKNAILALGKNDL